MENLRAAILASLEEYSDFDEFMVALDLAADNTKTPGIRLDAAKSVFESVVKSMLGHLDKSKSKNQLDRMTLVEASKLLLTGFGRYTDDIDTEFVEAMTEVIKRLSISRNNTGDISHGHVAPKKNSSEQFAKFAILHVEATCVYLFEVFTSIDLSYDIPEQYDSDNNIGFNAYLDEGHGPIGKVSYSRALYELDYDAWIDEKDRYEA